MEGVQGFDSSAMQRPEQKDVDDDYINYTIMGSGSTVNAINTR